MNEENSYTLTLTAQDIQNIGVGLLEAPTRIGAPLIEKINAQLAEQEAARAAAEEEAAKEKVKAVK